MRNMQKTPLNKNFSYYSNDLLRKGTLQESIDYICYFFSSLIAKKNKKHELIIKYVEDNINRKLKIETCLSNILLSEAYFEFLNLNKAIELTYKSLNICEEYKPYFQRFLFRLDHFLEKYNNIYSLNPQILFDYFNTTNDFKETFSFLLEMIYAFQEMDQYKKIDILLNIFENKFRSDLEDNQRIKISFLRQKAINFNKIGKFHSSIDGLNKAINLSVLNNDYLLDLLIHDYRLIYKFNKIELYPPKLADIKKSNKNVNNTKSKLNVPSTLSVFNDSILQLRMRLEDFTDNGIEKVNLAKRFVEFSNEENAILSYKHNTVANLLLGVGVYYYDLGHIDIAKDYYLKSLEKYSNYNDEVRTTLSSIAHIELANLYKSKGKKLLIEQLTCEESCIKALNKAIKYSELSSKSHISQGLTITRRIIYSESVKAAATHDLGKYEEAVSLYDNLLRRIESSEFDNSFFHSMILYNKALSTLELSKFDESINLLKDCLNIRKKLVPKNSISLKAPKELLDKLLFK